MTILLNSFESNTEKEYDNALVVATPKKSVDRDTRATALVSMTVAEKEKMTSKAKKHGLSLSAFFRIAVDEYMSNHNW